MSLTEGDGDGQAEWPDQSLVSISHVSEASTGKGNKFVYFLVVVQLIHRLAQADISCTTTARLCFFPLLVIEA